MSNSSEIDLELRCGCRTRPLLALCGRDALTGKPYVHVKIFKQGRVYGEVVATAGDARIRCRECARWSIVRIRANTVDFRSENLPDSISV